MDPQISYIEIFTLLKTQKQIHFIWVKFELKFISWEKRLPQSHMNKK